jgi:aminoglycoside phosphotransferase (APT) family kinase protein
MSIEDHLADWLSDEVGQAVTIGVTGRTAAGFSRENWIFDATWSGHTHRLIARRDPPGSVLETDRAVEVAVLDALRGTTVPAPNLRWADLSGDRLGRPSLVMDLAPGTCDPFILNGSRPLDDRLTVARRIYTELATIHRVDWGAIGLDRCLENPGGKAALRAVDHWEGVLRQVQLDPEPELRYVIAWLRANAPDNEVTTLVHGDFKPGNLLIEDDQVSAVLDWETVHLGDPHEDLGWVTNPLRAGEHRIADAWEPDDLLRHWSACTGLAVHAATVHWWQVLANVKLSIIVLTGHRAFVEGRLDRIHQAPVSLYAMLLDQIGA